MHAKSNHATLYPILAVDTTMVLPYDLSKKVHWSIATNVRYTDVWVLATISNTDRVVFVGRANQFIPYVEKISIKLYWPQRQGGVVLPGNQVSMEYFERVGIWIVLTIMGYPKPIEISSFGIRSQGQGSFHSLLPFLRSTAWSPAV
ncbi:hypothetical protein IW261DRAFT_1424360 [Armillaria novae-zelandiae]|uniref:Uncharacterized protein n=1 Tax=Armillaria novae-zelandiae TaxID=153914 RepID=A0AA39T902_9AGAR|nr:hypothetical protein IW261DRAFT_1424360 [Armillaria novae-zelandiae]